MPESPQVRQSSELSRSGCRQIDLYALAAGAAGVASIALSPAAEAKIIYTKTHQQIVHFVKLDLNHDGTPDFQICTSSTGHSCSSSVLPRPGPFNELKVVPIGQTNRVLGNREGKEVISGAFALPTGYRLGGETLFTSSASLMAGCFHSTSTYCGGPWFDVSRRYLGLKFSINGETHYGWARLTVNWKQNIERLTGYAYESVANKTIITGKTKGPDVVTVSDTLGGLAKGAVLHSRKVSLPKPR